MGNLGKIENRYLGHYKKMQKRAKPRTAPQPGLEPSADDHKTIPKQNCLPRSAKSYCRSENLQREVPI